jgi:glycosyltransferase involved in cell wall biosynthesis
MSIRIGVVIATRNRPRKLNELIKSLLDSSLIPHEIIIISSGDDISSYISEFSPELRINHRHIDGFGQIRQKMVGISLVSKETDWVLFLDDDLLLDKEALHNAIKYLEAEVPQRNVVGVGLNLKSTARLNSKNRVSKFIARKFLLDSKISGAVLRSGHPVEYLSSTVETSTEWLIGSSLWRKDMLAHYLFDFLEARYSALEDVIFSYRCKNYGDLVYLPDCKIYFQSNSKTKETLDVFIAVSFWRYYFFEINRSKFSPIAFLWSQFGRSIYFIFNSKERSESIFHSIFLSIKINSELFIQVVQKKNPRLSLEKNLRTRD